MFCSVKILCHSLSLPVHIFYQPLLDKVQECQAKFKFHKNKNNLEEVCPKHDACCIFIC